MLVLEAKESESIHIGEELELHFRKVKGAKTRIYVGAPNDIYMDLKNSQFEKAEA